MNKNILSHAMLLAELEKSLIPLPKPDQLDLVFNVFRSLQQHLLVKILNCTPSFCLESVCVLG